MDPPTLRQLRSTRPTSEYSYLSKRDIPAVLYELPLRPIKDKKVVAKRIGVLASLPQPRRQDVTAAPLVNNWFWQPSGMDINADGSAAIIVTYDAIYYYPREKPELAECV